METVLRRTSIMWNIVAGQARTNERVLGISCPSNPPGFQDNPLGVSSYYVGAVFAISCVVKNGGAAISAVRIYGTLAEPQGPIRFPAPGDAGEALVVMNKDLLPGQSVLRFPVGSGLAGVDVSPRILPPILLVEYTCTGTAGMQLALQVRASFIGTPPFGEETEDYAG